MKNQLITEAYIQYGFAGLSFILIGIIVWMITQLISVINNNNKVLAKLHDTANSSIEADEKLREAIKETKDEIRGFKDELLKRPCISKN